MLISKETDNPIEKWSKHSDMHFTEYIQVAGENEKTMERYSSS